MVIHPACNWDDHPLALSRQQGIFGFRDGDGELQLFPTLLHFLLAEGFQKNHVLREHILQEPSPKHAYSIAMNNRYRLDPDFVPRLPKVLYCGVLFLAHQISEVRNAIMSDPGFTPGLSKPFLNDLDLVKIYRETLARAKFSQSVGLMRVAVAGTSDVDDDEMRTALKWAFSRKRPDYLVLSGSRVFDIQLEAWAYRQFIPVIRHAGGGGGFHSRISQIVTEASHLLIIGDSDTEYLRTLKSKSHDSGLSVKLFPFKK